jgi:PAS domain-containing protein
MSTGVTGDDAFLRDVVVSSSLGVLVIDSTGLIVFSNGVLEGRLGYGPDDLLDSHLAEVCSTRAPVERVRDAIEASRGAPASVEVVLRDADDGEIQAVATCEADVFDGRR